MINSLFRLIKSFVYIIINNFFKFIFWIKLRFKGSAINFPFKCDALTLLNKCNFFIGHLVRIGKRSHLSIFPGASLIIGEGTAIGDDFVISCVNKITIGKNVLIADRVFIGDSIHDYFNIDLPIKYQSMSFGEVTIEDDCWIGINVSILRNVSIGRHSVIGANSVVTSNIPPFSVACGVPAKIIKYYNFEKAVWERLP
jgi:acetyltransferase-like isoleucine patch superfamily enzyme